MTLLFLVLLLTMFSTLLTATNADFAIPLIVDVAVLVPACSVICWALTRSDRQLRHDLIRFGAVLGLFLIMLLGRLIAAFGESYSEGAKLCRTMPALLPKLECLVMMDFSQQYGVRQMLFHLVAAVLLLAGWVFGRVLCRRPSFVIASFASFAFVGAVIAWMAMVGIIEHGPGFPTFVASQIPAEFGTAIMSNQGWVWPLLAPGLAALVSIILPGRSLPTIPRIATIGATALVIYVILATRQRGGYLLFGALVLTSIFGALWLARRHRSIRLAALGLAITGAMIGLIYRDGALPALLDAIGVPATKDPISTSESRLAIWSTAIRGIEHAPFTGNGYASWMPKFRDFYNRDSKHYVLPTAHNFFFQAAFELGIPHALAIAGLWAGIAIMFLRRFLARPGPGTTFGMLLIPAAVAVAAVQEIDHVNAIYYQFALGTGLALGLGSQALLSPPPTQDPSSRFILVTTGAIIALTTLLTWQVSWGGMAFGPNANESRSFIRDFRPSGVMATYPSRAGKAFSLMRFATKPDHPPRFGAGDSSSDGETYLVSDTAILLANPPTRLYGRSFRYRTEGYRLDPQRAVSFTLDMPPLQTNLGIFAEFGVSGWESDPHKFEGTRWCSQICRIALQRLPCAAGTSALRITAPRRDVSDTDPIELRSRIALAKNNDARRADLGLSDDTRFAALPVKTMTISHPDQSYDIVLPEGDANWGWIIELETDRAMIPMEHDASTSDSRTLGVKLADLVCVSR